MTPDLPSQVKLRAVQDAFAVPLRFLLFFLGLAEFFKRNSQN
jgi:hypothetical protein